MIPKIEIIKDGLANVRGGFFSFAFAAEAAKEDCIKDCLSVNNDVVGSIKGRVTSEETLQQHP